MSNAIEMFNVSKRFPTFSLNNISLCLPKGCIMGLIGENGAGKSTTIRLIMNAIPRDSGEISVLGCDNLSPDFKKIKEDIGVVLDEAYFPEVLTPKQVNGIMKNTYSRWDEAQYFGYLTRFQLPEKQKFKDFSRGMKMKLAIAVALSHAPKLLILDEATSGLDPIIRDEILEIFSEFTRSEEHSVLLSSHIVSDLEKLCDYIGFIHKGRLVLCEEKDRLLDTYGVLNCTKADFADLPEDAICGSESTAYGVRTLVRRDKVSNIIPLERTSLEEIILFLVKGEQR